MRFENDFSTEQLDTLKTDILKIRERYKQVCAKAWFFQKHDKDARLRQLAIVESVVLALDSIEAGVLNQHAIEPKLAILGAANFVLSMVASEYCSGNISSKLYHLLYETVVNACGSEVLKDINLLMKAEATFYKFMQTPSAKKELNNFLNNEFGVTRPGAFLKEASDELHELKQLRESSQFILINPHRKKVIGSRSSKWANWVSWLFYWPGFGTGYTLGEELANQFTGPVTVTGAMVGFSVGGPVGAAAGGTGAHLFGKRLLRRIFGFMFGGVLGVLTQKAAKGALYYLFWTTQGMVLVTYDLAKGVAYAVTDQEKLKEFVRYPDALRRNLTGDAPIEEADLVYADGVARETGFSELVFDVPVEEVLFDSHNNIASSDELDLDDQASFSENGRQDVAAESLVNTGVQDNISRNRYTNFPVTDPQTSRWIESDEPAADTTSKPGLSRSGDTLFF